MAQRVIHILEMIEIEMQQGEAFSAALHASHAFLNPLRERGAVKQAGERIESGHGQDLLFGALALGNVARDGDGKAFRPHLHRREGKFDGDFGPVFSKRVHLQHPPAGGEAPSAAPRYSNSVWSFSPYRGEASHSSSFRPSASSAEEPKMRAAEPFQNVISP